MSRGTYQSRFRGRRYQQQSRRKSLLCCFEFLETRTLLSGNPIANGTYNLTNGASGLYLDDTLLSSTAASTPTAPNSAAIMDQNTADPVNPVFGRDEMWQLTYNGAGFYTIMNINSGLYLEDYQGSTISGNPLYQDNADGGADQLWSLTVSGSSYVIVNDASGLVIDDPGSSMAARTNLDLATAAGGANQNWNFISAAIQADGVYTLKNGKSSKFLDNPGRSTTLGKQMVQNSSNGGYDQAWFFVFNGAGFYTIQNVASSLYLEDPGGSNTPGVALEQGAADGGADELWSLTPNGSSFIITNQQTGLVIDDFGNSTSSGAPVDLWTANKGSNQNWTFLAEPVIDSGIYTLTNGESGMLLDDPGSSMAAGTQIVQNPANGGRDEYWQFNYNGTGFYTIQSDISGLYLEDPGGSSTPGVGLVQAAADGGNDQLWYPMASGSSLVMHNLASGLVIDDPGFSTVAGIALDLWTANGGSNQAWSLAQPPLVSFGANGQLSYLPNASGDVIPDFSTVGYETGVVPLPDTTGGVSVPVKATVNPGAAGVDMTSTIQAAINAVSALTPDANGFRGAVLLTAGNYPISGQLSITASGVVLEGQGNNATTGTRLEATGTTQRLLINISGSGGVSTISTTKHNVTDAYVPEGDTSFDVDSAANLSVGQTVVVTGATNQAWIHAIGMDELNNPWSPGTGSQTYYRIITAIVGNKITINAPITNYIALQYGGGTIQAYTWSKIITNDGLENVYAYSDSTGSTDTNHATGVLNVNDAENVFVNNITSNGFASNHIVLGTVLYSTLTNLTIENTSVNADPPSGILTTGQFILVENSTFTNAYHAIAVNGGEGPNVFYNFTASGTTSQVGPHQRWSTGGLFDNDTISSSQLGVTNGANGGSGQGWAGAFYIFWNDMNAAEIDSFNPPTATNWVIGGSASAVNAPGHGDGQANVPGDFVDFGSAVSPQSLYIAQLLARETPTVATAAAANPGTVTDKTSALAVLGADVAGESTLTYTWSTTSLPQGATAPTFSINGTNAAKNATASFSKAGAYTLKCTISFPGGLSVTSSANVTVNATLTTILVSPNPVTVGVGLTQHFAAVGLDQFGTLLSSQPTFAWSLATGSVGAIDGMGLYTASSSPGSATVRATSSLVTGTASVTIVAPPIILGDFNQDGHVDAGDIMPEMQALTNPAGYEAQYGVSAANLQVIGDVNCDGNFNNADMQALIYKLVSGGGSLSDENQSGAIASADAQADNTSNPAIATIITPPPSEDSASSAPPAPVVVTAGDVSVSVAVASVTPPPADPATTTVAGQVWPSVVTSASSALTTPAHGQLGLQSDPSALPTSDSDAVTTSPGNETVAIANSPEAVHESLFVNVFETLGPDDPSGPEKPVSPSSSQNMTIPWPQHLFPSAVDQVLLAPELDRGRLQHMHGEKQVDVDAFADDSPANLFAEWS